MATSLVSPLLSTIAPVLTGIFGQTAAGKAGSIIQNANQSAGAGVNSAQNQYLPTVVAAGQNAGDRTVTAADTNQDNVNTTAANAASGVTTAANQANLLLNPYSTAGSTAASTIASGEAPGGDFNSTPTLAQLQMDPGYAFREQQAEEAMQRQAAAGGGVMGGGFDKALDEFSQADASQEYQAAFNRFEQSTENRFANLNTTANAGQAAANVQGANDTGAAKYAGDTTTQADEFGAGQELNANEFAGNANVNAADLTAEQAIKDAQTVGNYNVAGADAAAAAKVGGFNALFGGINNGINNLTSGLTTALTGSSDNSAGGFGGGATSTPVTGGSPISAPGAGGGYTSPILSLNGLNAKPSAYQPNMLAPRPQVRAASSGY